MLSVTPLYENNKIDIHPSGKQPPNTQLVPHFIHARKTPTPSLVPKRIFQTWKSRYISDDVYNNNIKPLLENNPEYDYYLFGDEECREYLARYYAPEYLQAFDDLIPGAFKADFWRYAILYREGGVYIDLDLIVSKPLNDIIPNDASFVSIKDRTAFTNQTAIYQAFIATVPLHNFLNYTLLETLHNIQTYYFGSSCLGITGPITMGNAISKYLNTNKLEPGVKTYPKDGKVVLYEFLNYIEIIVDSKNEKIFGHKFEGYQSLTNYSNMFSNRKVYHSYKLNIFDYIIINMNWIILLVVAILVYKYLKQQRS